MGRVSMKDILADKEFCAEVAYTMGVSAKVAAACFIEEPISKVGGLTMWIVDNIEGSRAEKTEALIRKAKKDGLGIYGIEDVPAIVRKEAVAA